MPAIAFDRVTALRQRVFELRESTADEASEPFSIAELIDATQATRAVIRSILRALPDGAFDRQPDDTDGNDVWSAGQVVSHICEARVRFDHYGVLRRLAGLPEAPPSEAWPEYIGGPKLLSRAQSLEALDLLEEEYDNLANSLPDDVDLAKRVELQPFGSMGFRGILMQNLLHENLHEEQLRDLGGPMR